MSHPQFARLGNVAQFIRGISFKPEAVVPVGTVGSVVCMRTKNVQAELELGDVWAVSASHVKRDEQYLQPGDILVSSANSWNLVGKCCWIPELPWRASFGGFVSVLRPVSNAVDPRYLYHWFSSERIQATVRSFGRQTTNIANLDTNRSLELMLPLPPLAEQRRIADVLDRAEALQRMRRAALEKLGDLSRVAFLSLFGDPITNPRAWPVALLSEVASTTSGGTPSRDNERYFGGGIPWVKSGELHQGLVTNTEETLTELGLRESSAKVMPPGTILVAMYGATVGVVAVLAIEAATNQAVCCIQPGDRVMTDYLVAVLRCMTPVLLQRRSGGAQPNISQAILRELAVPLPPVELQCEFARRIASINHVIRLQERALSSLDSLLASIEYRAFQGEL